jgi:hypothetical protein
MFMCENRGEEKKKTIDFQPKLCPSHMPYGNEEVVERI